MMQDQTILITGASSGLGRALAIELSQQGAQLFLTGRNLEALKKTQALCASPEKIQLATADLTNEQEVEQLFLQVQHLPKLDVLVLNAGMTMWAKFENLADISPIDTIMATNFTAQVRCIQHALPILKKSNGQIVAVSSLQGKLGVPYHTGYAASKHALTGFLDSLRLELQNQVRVLTVYPSWLKGTSLRKNGISEQSTKVSEHHERGTDVKDCSKAIVSAMQKNKQSLFVPWYYQCLPTLAWLFPKVLDHLIIKKTSSNVQSKES